MANKEKILLAIVIAAVAGTAALDTAYKPVPVPPTKAPTDVPVPPPGAEPVTRWPRPTARSMFDPYSDLISPPFVELPDLPTPSMPVAVPPVRPWIHMDAAAGHRHFLFDPAEAPASLEETSGGGAEPANGGGAENVADGFIADPAAAEKKPAPEPVDLSLFDWVRQREGLGQAIYGKIDLMPADREKRSRFDLLVDDALEFTFWPADKDGKLIGGPVPYRHLTGTLGFADTFENNYGSKRVRLEAAAGRKTLDIHALRELVAWSLEEAKKPKYARRQAWGQAEKDLREIVVRTPDDKETLKDLGRVLRLLQDLEGEAGLYDWWLSRQQISKDPEVLALLAEALEMLGLRDRARALYEESLVTNPDARVRLRLGDLCLQTGSLEDARKAVEIFRRAAQDGERAPGSVGEARALLALGDLDGAEAALAKVQGGEKDPSWYNAAGALHYGRGRYEEARGHFQAALDKAKAGDDAFPNARTNVAVAKARLAALLPEADAARRTLLEEAVKAAEEALADDPLNYYWPLVARAYAERASGAREKSVETLQEAVAALPSEAYGRYLLGEFLLRDGRNAEARTQFLEATRLAPRFPDGLGGVGRAGGGGPGEAKEYLRRAMELEPRSALWPFLAARMAFLDEGMPMAQRLADAQRDLTILLEKVDRNHAYAQAALGWVRYYQGFPGEALDRWNTALRLIAGFRPSSPREQQMADALADWLKNAIQKVSKWMNTKIWRDEFNRPNGPTVANGWSEIETPGVKISIVDGAAQIGPGRVQANEAPALWTERDAAKVLKGSIEVNVAPTEPIQVDLLIYMPQGKNVVTKMGLRKTESGEMVLLLKKDQRTKESDEVVSLGGARWPENGQVSFGFVKMNEEKGQVALLLDGKPIAGYEAVELQTLIKSRGGKLRFEVRCTALGGTEVNTRVEAAEVWLDIQQ